ncbi:MAG: DUF6456 domain-containing protein [Pseudomonadota bacterium]
MDNQNKENAEEKKQRLRLAKVLSTRRTTGFRVELQDTKIAIEYKTRKHHFPKDVLLKMAADQHVEILGEQVRLTDQGVFHLQNALGLSPTSAPSSQATHETTQLTNPNEVRAQVNLGESPLARLYARKSANGKSYLSDSEYKAGERLRKDFEQGQLQPRISARFETAVGSSKASGVSAVDIPDLAIDARRRVNRALESLGPELSGVTLDICCFLKGFELVERERKWPPRSAKLMLRTALSILARHYGFEMSQTGHSTGIKFWGAEDYRPPISTSR